MNSNDQGRAFEYVCLQVLYQEINKIRPASIEKNSVFFADEHAWSNLNESLKSNLIKSAKAVTDVIFELEPLILEKDKGPIKLRLQFDRKGEEGDVRDIVISRDSIAWEIGLSLKHNHFAVKHSRLAKRLDFGSKWYNQPCSPSYWKVVSSIFDYLELEKNKNTEWKQLPDKEEGVYVPLLQAFMDEVKRSALINPNIPKKMVEYLLGEYDFYKVISVDVKKFTQIESFNIHGTLNKASKKKKPIRIIPVVSLPTRIVAFEFKPNSNNTLELYMDGGWTFSFRIHNASTIVEPSLKFDIQIVGMPTTILTLNCLWKD